MQQPHPFYASRTSFVLDALHCAKKDSREPRLYLDIGFVGEGQTAYLHDAICEALSPGDHMTGIDTNEDALARFLAARAAGSHPDIRTNYVSASLYDTGFAEQSFDAVFLCEVLEHLSTPYLALQAITKLIRPGGALIITYPNPLSLAHCLRYVKQKDLFEPSFLRRFRGHPEHLVFPHPACLAVSLQAMGFSTGSVSHMKMHGGEMGKWCARVVPFIYKFSCYIGICAQRSEPQ